jgi:hypothetical protein
MKILDRPDVAAGLGVELLRRGRTAADWQRYLRGLGRTGALGLVWRDRCNRTRNCVECRRAIRHLAVMLDVTEVEVRLALLALATNGAAL